jgi:tripartite-type tricarboxylate transporter receptor subunit TctC
MAPNMPWRGAYQIPSSGMARRTNCRMHHFQLVAARTARTAAGNKLFFQGDFREDRAREKTSGSRIKGSCRGVLHMPRPSHLAIAIAAFMLMSASAGAQEYPTKPITLIVPWPAGGSTDISMRAIAESASKVLGQPIAIDNKAGGSGTVGPATMAAAAKPDGYTIAQIPITVFRLPLMQEVSWNPDKDFTYIIHLTGYTFGVTTSAESPFKTWQDVVDYAKQNPGKVTYATPGAGTSLHIGMEQIASMAGIKLTQVPFKGGAETNAAVLGQHTMLQADSTGWRPLVDAGKLRLLMVWTSARSPNYPDVPTLKELGYPMVYDSPFGIAGPKGMDPKIVAKLHDAFKKALEDPAVIATLAKFDMVPNYKNTEDYKKFVAEVTESERKVIDRLGLAKKTN